MTEPAVKLPEALLKAQREMPAVEPDGVNPHFKSRFVTLGNLLSKVRPVLNKNGITVLQFPSRADDGSPTLTTILLHESGEKLEYAAPLLLPKQDPQGQGSAITYLRRFALAAALAISDQEDDDGNAATKAEAPPAQASANASQLLPILRAAGFDLKEAPVVAQYIAEKFSLKQRQAALDALSSESPEAILAAVDKLRKGAEKFHGGPLPVEVSF